MKKTNTTMELTASQLRAALHIGRTKLAALIKMRLPVKRRGRRMSFEPQKVRDWLIAHDLAEAPEFVPTLSGLAAAIGTTRQTLTKWIQDGKVPRRTREGYDVRVYRQYKESRSAGTSGTDGKWRLRFLREQAAAARRKRIRFERTFVLRSEVEKCQEVLRRHLLTAAEQLGQKFGKRAQEVATACVSDCQREFESFLASQVRSKNPNEP